MKIVDIDRKILHNFNENFKKDVTYAKTLKVTKKQGFMLSLEDAFFEKP